MNPFLTAINELWALQLSSFAFRNTTIQRETDIIRYFGLAFQLSRKYPKKPVLKYAISRVSSLKIEEKNWDLFESFILKTALLEPAALPKITEILRKYEKIVNREKIEEFIEALIKNHIVKGNHFEVSWALWLARIFMIEIKKEIAEDIFKSNDVISIILAFDLKQNNLICSEADTSILMFELNKESLYRNKWLLTYEFLAKKWLVPKGKNPLDSDPFFKLLKDKGVTFYEDIKKGKQVTTSKTDEIISHDYS